MSFQENTKNCSRKEKDLPKKCSPKKFQNNIPKTRRIRLADVATSQRLPNYSTSQNNNQILRQKWKHNIVY